VLDWEGCFNVRDLGGLPTVDGRTTRFEALVRADSLCRLTEAGCRAARAHGLSAVIDLRGQHEIDERHVIRRLATGPSLEPAGEHPFCPPGQHADGVLYRRLRLWISDELFRAQVRAATSQMQIYRIILDGGAAGFAALAREVVAAPSGSVVVHCQVGKDRTGLAVALMLSAVGATDDAIAADYALSAGYLRPYLDYRRTLGAAPSAEPADGMTSPAETMLALLGEIRETRGGAAGYLRAGGLTEQDLGALERRLIG
jgi:protein tyrosine/serine phosphatase